MYVFEKSESEVTQSCPTLCNLMDCSLPGSSVDGIFQARVLEWVAFSFSKGSSWPRDQTWVFSIAGRCLTLVRNKLHFFLLDYSQESNYRVKELERFHRAWYMKFYPQRDASIYKPNSNGPVLPENDPRAPPHSNTAESQKLWPVLTTTLPSPRSKPSAEFCDTAHWGFNWDGIELIYHEGRADLFIMLFSNLWTWYSSPLTEAFLSNWVLWFPPKRKKACVQQWRPSTTISK